MPRFNSEPLHWDINCQLQRSSNSSSRFPLPHSDRGIRQMMSSNDTASAVLFLRLMVSPMLSDFGGFCGRSACRRTGLRRRAGGERWQKSTIWSLLHGALGRVQLLTVKSWSNTQHWQHTSYARPNRCYFCATWLGGRGRYVNWSEQQRRGATDGSLLNGGKY